MNRQQFEDADFLRQKQAREQGPEFQPLPRFDGFVGGEQGGEQNFGGE